MISKFPTLKFTFLSGLALVALTGCEIQYGLNEGTELVTGADSQDGQGTTGGEDIPDSVATGSLQGRVCAPNGAGWIVGATVYIDTEWGRLETTSDENGWFVLEGVPEGDYTVHFIKGSFESSMDVRIIADERSPKRNAWRTMSRLPWSPENTTTFKPSSIACLWITTSTEARMEWTALRPMSTCS